MLHLQQSLSHSCKLQRTTSGSRLLLKYCQLEVHRSQKQARNHGCRRYSNCTSAALGKWCRYDEARSLLCSQWLFLVREYSCNKYLSKARNDSSIQEIDNLEDVLHLNTPAEVQQMTDMLHGGQVVAVPKLDSIKVCMCCKGRVEPSNPPFGRCSVATCSMLQRYDICSVSTTAQLLLLSDSTGNRFTALSVPGGILTEMAGDKVTEKH